MGGGGVVWLEEVNGRRDDIPAEGLFIGVISEYQMGRRRNSSWAKAKRNGQRDRMRKQAGARGVGQWGGGGGRGERVGIDRRWTCERGYERLKWKAAFFVFWSSWDLVI